MATNRIHGQFPTQDRQAPARRLRVCAAMLVAMVLAVMMLGLPDRALAETDAGIQALHEGDYGIAIKELTWPAKAGDPRAQANLGTIYHYGLGVATSFARALRWYHAAAIQGNADGAIGLAILYYYGQGVTKDLVTAHFWLTVALGEMPYGRDRDRVDADRDAMAGGMTPDQLQKSAALMQNWTTNHQAP